MAGWQLLEMQLTLGSPVPRRSTAQRYDTNRCHAIHSFLGKFAHGMWQFIKNNGKSGEVIRAELLHFA